MSVMPEVKCARCDRVYSGLRSRCPYCGARRIGAGKFSGENDNARGKMIIGVLIMAVLVVAAGILLFATPKPVEEDPGPGISSPDNSTPPIEEDIDSIEGTNPATPPPTEEPDTSDEPSSPPPKVESVIITYSGYLKEDFTASIGEEVPLRAKIEPFGIELPDKIIWLSSDTAVFDVVPDDDGYSATVYGLGVGTATLTVIAGAEEAYCIVRVT